MMKITTFMAVLLFSLNGFCYQHGCNLFWSQGESIRFKNDEDKIERTMSKEREKGWTYISQGEWKKYKKLSEEIFKDEYSSMTDDHMMKAIATKWKMKVSELKELNINGLRIDQNCSKLK